MTDNSPATETAGEMIARVKDNAQLWAQEFNKTAVEIGYQEMDEGWLIGWFANAIECSHALRIGQLDPIRAETAKNSGEVVAYQRRFPNSEWDWIECRKEDIAHYQGMGQEVRALYLAAPANVLKPISIVSDSELEQWASKRADDAGRLARELIEYRRIFSALATPANSRALADYTAPFTDDDVSQIKHDAKRIASEWDRAVPANSRTEADERIENATQAASETHQSWKSRCYAILAALNLDFGDNDEPTLDEVVIANSRAEAIGAIEADSPLLAASYYAMSKAMELLDADLGHGTVLNMLAKCRCDIENRRALLDTQQPDSRAEAIGAREAGLEHALERANSMIDALTEDLHRVSQAELLNPSCLRVREALSAVDEILRDIDRPLVNQGKWSDVRKRAVSARSLVRALLQQEGE